jgi:phosphate transport system permease protein
VLSGERWYPIEGLFGLWPLVLGSVLVTLGAAALAIPAGLLVAVFVAEVAPRWLREIVKPLIEMVAGIPSVVLGFLGMLMLSPLIREAFNAPTGLTALSGSLVLAYMALPTIISIAEDAELKLEPWRVKVKEQRDVPNVVL